MGEPSQDNPPKEEPPPEQPPIEPPDTCTKVETKIEIEEVVLNPAILGQPPPDQIPRNPYNQNPYQQNPYQQNPYQQNQPNQNYYYHDPSYNQRQTPAYQQQVGGQNVYVSGDPNYPPPDVSRGQGAYRANYPGQGDDYREYRDMGIFTDTFSSVKIRNRFVQRVYTILSVQLFFTFLVVLLITFVWALRVFVFQYFLILLILGTVIVLITMIALVCCVNLRRSFPTNFILLGLLTVGMTIMIAPSVALTHPLVILAATGTTAGVCILVSIFACQTSWDVTGCGMCFCILTLVLLLYGIVITILALAGINLPILHIVYSALAVLIFCLWLMYDTQMIMGGRRIELSPEEYIFGALTLYVDVIVIFINLMSLYNQCLGGE
ncbi:hypothetical protein Zmor_015924 [Zophobas morio]|uniref:Uncharacterized protein n=1 Tax=Zophobas morio TaxID=2755281 RepID=A0AA38IP93_9CUCU|nr:hypothetical protein Zmor_015924 [Zophobas morio]